jgi:hypothetical protein
MLHESEYECQKGGEGLRIKRYGGLTWYRRLDICIYVLLKGGKETTNYVYKERGYGEETAKEGRLNPK